MGGISKAFGFFLLILTIHSCDIVSPQRHFIIAVPDGDFTYHNSANHLKTFLEKGGFSIEIITCLNAIEANKMVAEGKADLTFIMNHSSFIPEAIGDGAGKLRTILPLSERLFFLFYKDGTINDSLTDRELLSNKSIGIEVLNGETHTNLERLMQKGKIENVTIVQKDDNPDYIHFWGTYYGERATNLLENNWRERSISSSWINFITLNSPALTPITLPAIPGIPSSMDINTFSVRTLLVGRSGLGEKAAYQLIEYVIKHKLELMGYDLMYRDISEHFDQTSVLYPLHDGTDAYRLRNEPTFFERYANLLALLFSVAVIVFGGIQAYRNKIAKNKKDRLDMYFLEFLDIKSNGTTNKHKAGKYDNLLERALVQVTKEKMDRGDFHILSRLIQQELQNIK
jgi:TRAP-type uncharacterized transport system substrate-binding protein